MGNNRKLKSLVDGWVFCGRAGQCECARKKVSQSVSAATRNHTAEKKEKIQRKREKTNLERYGHANTGQIEKAKIAHKEFYSNEDNVSNQVQKQISTLQRLYGVTNTQYIPAIKEKSYQTSLNRYGHINPILNKEISSKSAKIRKDNGFYGELYYRNNYNKLFEWMKSLQMNLLTSFENYNGTSDNINLECVRCKKAINWTINYHEHLAPYCKSCNPKPKSQPELDIFNYIKNDLGISDVIMGDWGILPGFEIDIHSKEHKIAIEHNGLYYHSETFKSDHSYHLNKLVKMEDDGYRLFSIFGDEWQERSNVVKSKLAYMFGKINDKRYARKLELRDVGSKEANDFYHKSHIQGSVNSSHHVGLYDSGLLVASMSFSPSRPSQNLPTNSYQLTRFAISPFMTVIGGASRMFSNFLRTHNPSAVISYADRRWSDGGLYKTLGFKLTRTNKPSYSYIDSSNSKRYFRFGFRKDEIRRKFGHILGDIGDDVTEWEMMQLLGFDRIWDCGSYTFVWHQPCL